MQVKGQSFHGTYGTARMFASITSALGWVIVIVGAIVLVVGFQQIRQYGVFGVVGGFVAIMVGLIQVQLGQSVRASLDSADYARQTFALHLAQAQGLNEVDLGSGMGRGSAAGPAIIGIVVILLLLSVSSYWYYSTKMRPIPDDATTSVQ